MSKDKKGKRQICFDRKNQFYNHNNTFKLDPSVKLVEGVFRNGKIQSISCAKKDYIKIKFF